MDAGDVAVRIASPLDGSEGRQALPYTGIKAPDTTAAPGEAR